MSDVKISDLSAVGSLTGAETAELVQGGVNKKSTLQKIVEFVANSLFIEYTVDPPATPAFPNAKACAFDPTGLLPTRFWDPGSAAWT